MIVRTLSHESRHRNDTLYKVKIVDDYHEWQEYYDVNGLVCPKKDDQNYYQTRRPDHKQRQALHRKTVHQILLVGFTSLVHKISFFIRAYDAVTCQFSVDTVE